MGMVVEIVDWSGSIEPLVVGEEQQAEMEGMGRHSTCESLWRLLLVAVAVVVVAFKSVKSCFFYTENSICEKFEL